MIIITSESENDLSIIKDEWLKQNTHWYDIYSNELIEHLNDVQILIIIFTENTILSNKIITYKKQKLWKRATIIPVYRVDFEGVMPTGIEDMTPLCLQNDNENEKLELRIRSHLGIRNLPLLVKDFNNDERMIFISYRFKDDYEKAEALVYALKGIGYSVIWDEDWSEDQATMESKSEKETEEIIDKYLDKSLFLVLIHTSETKNSPIWIKYEVDKAIATKRLIQKVSFDDLECHDFKSIIERCLPFGNVDLNDQVDKAVFTIEALLGESLKWQHKIASRGDFFD